MGSPCELKFYAKSQQSAKQVADKVIADVKRIEQRYSRYQEDSMLSAINRVAEKGGSIEVDEETMALLNYANTCYQQSAGLFDISSGILRKAWDFKSKTIPKQAEIKQLLKSIGWKKIKLTEKSISFSVSGMQLDFGGIGKEYAVDRAAAICWQHGIQHGLVNLGGDIKIIGPHIDGKPWIVGISHPRMPNELLTSLSLYSGGVASSGDYQRCIEINGKRYSHVLNPKTGWPVRGLSAVTVVAEQCVIAGSACTIAMLMEGRGKRWLDKLGAKHIWVDMQGKVGGRK
jgi:thiamine biosynthesis lipoprotein